MKKGNLLNGLEVVDVKRINKLNLIQFLKEVDSYLQKGYKIDVTSGRQVGLVLQADVYKTEAASSPKVGSTGVKEEEVKANAASEVDQETEAAPEGSVVPESTVQQEKVSVEDVVKEEVPVAPKKITTRSKKTTQ